MINLIAGLSVFAAACAMAAAPLAHAQDGGGRPPGQLTLKRVLERDTNAPAEEPAAAAPAADAGGEASVVAAPSPALAKAPIFASGAPREMAPVAVTRLVMSVCGRDDGSGLVAAADARGMGEPQPPPAQLIRALPSDARTWRVPSSDGEVYLVGYDVAPMRCGAAVLYAIPGGTFEKAQAQLMGPEHGFVVDSSQVMAGDVQWTRLRAADGQFIDVMEYPERNGLPPAVRLDYLPK